MTVFCVQRLHYFSVYRQHVYLFIQNADERGLRNIQQEIMMLQKVQHVSHVTKLLGGIVPDPSSIAPCGYLMPHGKGGTVQHLLCHCV